jgi:hypothetical protein
MPITPGTRLNPGLGRVDYNKQLQAMSQARPFLAQQRIQKSAENIKIMQEEMATYKQKKEQQKLVSNGVAYIQRLFSKGDEASKQVIEETGINPSNPDEIKNLFKVGGGVEETISKISDAIGDVRALYQEREEERNLARDIQSIASGIGEVSQALDDVQTDNGEGTDGSVTGLSKESQVYMRMLDVMSPEDVDKYKDFFVFDDPETGTGTERDAGDEYIKDLKNFRAETEANDGKAGQQPYIVDLVGGIIKYNEPFSLMEEPLNPGDPKYEAFRDRYPDLVKELEKRRNFRYGTDEGTSAPIESEFTQEEIDSVKSKYGLK